MRVYALATTETQTHAHFDDLPTTQRQPVSIIALTSTDTTLANAKILSSETMITRDLVRDDDHRCPQHRNEANDTRPRRWHTGCEIEKLKVESLTPSAKGVRRE